MASVAGVRPQTDKTAETSWILVVRSAISASTVWLTVPRAVPTAGGAS